MNTLTESEAWKMLSYKNPEDILADNTRELASLSGMPEADAKTAIEGVLDNYHSKKSGYPTGLDRDIFSLIVHLTQSYRIPVMTSRMDKVIPVLEEFFKDKTDPVLALDYGGGGGKDSIILSKLGHQVTYSDILSTLTPYVLQRFKLRGLDISAIDVRDLESTTYDLINCLDVIEHCYDVEYVTADVIVRLKHGGVLVLWPAFFNSWDGDHVEKNCGYEPYYTTMLESVGMRLVGSDDAVQFFVRDRPMSDSMDADREAIRKELYILSEKLSSKAALTGLAKLAPRIVSRFLLRRNSALDPHVNTIIDNLAIRRLSRHQLAVLKNR